MRDDDREFAAFLHDILQDYREDCRRTNTEPLNERIRIEKGGAAE